MVQIVNLKKSFGARVLFAEINLKLDTGKRYGLIGANGAGNNISKNSFRTRRKRRYYKVFTLGIM